MSQWQKFIRLCLVLDVNNHWIQNVNIYLNTPKKAIA
jgi:hypothetical protein